MIRATRQRLGFDRIKDEAFFQLVLARLVEPTSKLDSLRVLEELGITPSHHNTYYNALRRSATKDYREQLAAASFTHVWNQPGRDVSVLLYDVTTLYFEAEKEDELRKVGYSKERRVDPQIVVGMLVDRLGHPLETACFEGNKPETHTIIPILEAFQTRHQVADMVVVADTGMLSASNLDAIDAAGLRFIVGSRATKAPHDLAKHFHWHGNVFDDGQIIDTTTSRRGLRTRSGSSRAGNRYGTPRHIRMRGDRFGSTPANAPCVMGKHSPHKNTARSTSSRAANQQRKPAS